MFLFVLLCRLEAVTQQKALIIISLSRLVVNMEVINFNIVLQGNTKLVDVLMMIKTSKCT